MKQNSIKKNTIFNFICQFVNLVAPLITGVYIARVLDAELIGQNSYIASICSYFSLIIVFGTNLYGTVAVSKARDDFEEKSRIFYELNIIKFFCFLASCFFYSFLVIFYVEYQTLLAIYLISLLSSLVDITWYFQGIERFDFISLRTVITKVLAVSFVFIFIKSKDNFYLYVIFSLSSTLIPNLLLFPMAKKELVKVKIQSLNWKKHLKKLVPFFLVNALISIYSVMDKTMLKLITGSNQEVGYYEQAYKIYNLCSTLTVVIGPVINARIAFVYDDKEKRDELFDLGFRFAFMMSFPIMVGCLMLSSEIIDVFFGDGYESSKNVLMVFSVLPLITSIGMMTGHMYYTPRYKTRISIVACAIGAIVNFGLNILMSYFYGAFGAAVATIIAEFIISTIEIILFKDLDKKQFLLSSVKYIFASLIMGVILFLLNKFIFIDNKILELVFKVMICAISYFACLLIMKEKLMFMGFKEIYNKFKGLRINRK